jgi:uncharacterized membrane protein YkvA (DUF1232 family)
MNWVVLAIALGVAAAVLALAVGVLLAIGRRAAARALASLLPDCAVLCRRLARDPRVPRRHKLLLLGLVVYMAMPFDLMLDVIPVVGQLDDMLLFTLVLRSLLRAAGRDVVCELWPGPAESLTLILRLAARKPRAKQVASQCSATPATRACPETDPADDGEPMGYAAAAISRSRPHC